MSLWHILEQAVARCPDHLAVVVVDGDERWTYHELGERCHLLAAVLRARSVRPGDRIAILARNCADYLVAYFAAAGLGAILTPLNARLSAPELSAILADSGARTLCAEGHLAAAALALCHRLPLDLLWLGDPPAAAATPFPTAGISARRAMASLAGTTIIPAPCRADDPAQLYYTSGTTGRPKGVVLTHGNVDSHARITIQELGLGDRDVWAHVAPLFHLADAWATFAITAAGGTHVTIPRFDPATVLRAFETHRITITNLIPTMLNLMVEHENARAFDYRSLRAILSGGAPIAPAVVAAVLDTFGCEYVQTYGLTETSPFVTMSLLDERLCALPAPERLRYLARTGRPVRGVDVRVVDQNGHPVARDDRQVGEIQVRGPTVTPGYWQQPDATRAAFTGDGFFRTGDLAVVDASGFLDIVDRKKDVILTGGETVYSIEVEQQLNRNPIVLEAAVYGAPDPLWGERVVAAVVLRRGASATAQEIVDSCRQSLAGFKLPKEVRFLDELPRTGSGKIQKRLLRDAEPGPAADHAS